MQRTNPLVLAGLLVTTAAPSVLAQEGGDRADRVKGRDTPQHLVATYEAARARKDWRTCFSCYDRQCQAGYVMGVFFVVGLGDEELAAIVKRRLRIEFTDPEDMEIPGLRLDDDVPDEILLGEAVRKRVDDLPGFIEEICRWADAKGQQPLFESFGEVEGIEIRGDRAVGTYLAPPLPPYRNSAGPKVDEPADPVEPQDRGRRLPLDFRRIDGAWYFTVPEPPSPLSPEERARTLKSNVRSLWITLGICGDSSTSVTVEKERDGRRVRETIEISGSELRLGMESGRHGYGSGFYKVAPETYYAGLTEAQALRLIDYLATEGFLKQAREPETQKIPFPRLDQRNWVQLQVSLQPGEFGLYENLGWGPAMRKRLVGLRDALGGDAAKGMDEILSRLPDDR
jgi:hypothetical protein